MKCPKCGRKFPRLLAVSREDNKAMICDSCGMMEALLAMQRHTTTPVEKARAAGNSIPYKKPAVIDVPRKQNQCKRGIWK